MLDGATDPALSFEDFTEQSAVADEAALKSFLEDCAMRPDCPYYVNGETARRFEDLRARLNTTPLVVTYPSGAVVKIDGDGMTLQARRGLNSSAGWSALARALADADFMHDGMGLANLGLNTSRDPSAESEQNFVDAGTVINCLTPPLPSLEELDRFARTVVAEAPHFGDLWGI